MTPLFRLKLALMRWAPLSARRKIMFPRYEEEIGSGGEAELQFLNDLVRPGDFVFDVGANIGVYTYAMSKIAKTVIAVEPNPAMARLVMDLRLDNVQVLNAAASDQYGESALNIPKHSAGHIVASLRSDVGPKGMLTDQMMVPTLRLDGLGHTGVNFIKIDVEGFEEQAISGAQGIMERDRPTFLIEIEERHNPGGLARVVAKFKALGYSIWFLAGGQWKSFEQFDLARDQDDTNMRLPGVTRRTAHYVNNFVFTPTSRPPGT